MTENKMTNDEMLEFFGWAIDHAGHNMPRLAIGMTRLVFTFKPGSITSGDLEVLFAECARESGCD